MIAALYIDRRGPYASMSGVDPWDIKRDARSYVGPLPVVAHPPCGPWGSLSHLYEGNEHDCAPLAIAAVRKWGGVLEHPIKSKLWCHAGAPELGAVDVFGGFVVDVDQCAWGHVARKRTRLYMVGISHELVISTMRTGGTPTHWVSGSRNAHGRKTGRGGNVPPGIKVCSPTQRRRTPHAFARWLVELAATAIRPWSPS